MGCMLSSVSSSLFVSSYLHSYLVLLVPVCTLPVIGALIWLNFRAKKLGIKPAVEQAAAAEAGVDRFSQAHTVPVGRRIKSVIDELDAFGLILLGFGWSLFLLPFSLESGAKGGWSNPSMIAMSGCLLRSNRVD